MGRVNVTGFAVSAATAIAAAVVGEMMTAGDIFSLQMDGRRETNRIVKMNDSSF